MPNTLFPKADPETRARLGRSASVQLINEHDWSATPLGPIRDWPEALKGVARMMVSSSSPMVVMAGPEGNLIYNDAYALFAGQRHPEIFGLGAEVAWPEIAPFNRERMARGRAGEPEVLRDQELVLERNGAPETIWMDLHYSPVFGDAGEPLGTLCICHDITQRVLAERAVQRSEERLSLALSGSALVGIWDWNVKTDRVTADRRFAELYGIDPDDAATGVSIDHFVSAIHEADRDRVGAEIADAVRTGEPFHSEYRLSRKAGGAHWVIASGSPRTDGEGRTVRFPGVVVDVTEQKQIEEALAHSEARFRTLADAMPQMVWSTLPDGFHDYYNARWYQFTGVPAGETDGEAWSEVFHPEDRERAWASWRHSLKTGETYEIEYRLRHHSGQYRWTLGRALPLRDGSGTIMRWFGTCTDIHDTKVAAEERELVAQELAHRIKNIFAVITGIIGLSARGQPEIRPYADKLRERIFALGDAHDFVRLNAPRSAAGRSQSSLFALVKRLLTPYQTDLDAHLGLEGEDAAIDDGAIIPLALLVHELATNSAKYGALSRAEGRVVVTGTWKGEDYRFDWRETGGPPVPAALDRTGFGSRLISLSVEGQMHGRVERIWAEEGLAVVVDVPRSALVRSARLGSSTTG